MKQGSYSFAPSIKKWQGAPCKNSLVSNTVIKRKGPFNVVPTHDTIIKRQGAHFSNPLVIDAIIKEVGPLKAVPHLKKQGAPCGNSLVVNTI